MRIVHVTNSTQKGQLGVEKHVLELATEQKARGLNIGLMVDRKEGLAEACRQRNMPVTIVEDLDTFEPGGARQTSRPAERVTQRLLAQFESLDPDLIHIHTPPAASQAIPAANLRRTPCIFSMHANKAPGPQGFHPLVESRKRGMTFAVICMSNRDFEDLKRCGFPDTDLYYVPHGTRTVMPAPPEIRQSNRPNLIFAGSLIDRKRADLAILTMAGLRQRNSRSCPVLYIYGDGEEREYLSEVVKLLEMGQIVRFCGYQPDILEQCPDTDILIMPSDRETGPLTVLEAMSRGMPIVSTDVGDVTSMLPDQRYGRVVPPNSVIALADAVESLILDIDNARFDKNLLIERHRLLYTKEKMAQRTEDVYSSVLARFRPGPSRRVGG
jgi:glycosyltransferase involved in cell wall biosynthesis